MLYLHCLATIDTLQDFRMRINKFQLYPSLSKKLNVIFFFFDASLNSLEIPTISSAWSCNYDINLSVFRHYV